MKERERYRPFLITEDPCIYTKGDKSLLITKKEITFQTSVMIWKRERKIRKGNLIKETNNGY